MNNEQNEKMGRLICELRKTHKLTQKELAEKLNVTDKAVSKWERGISCPDVSLLIPLAQTLHVSTGELLNGEKNSALAEKKEDIVEEALLYSEWSNSSKFGKIRRGVMAVLFVSIALAVIICLICDISINRKLSWSLIVLVTLVLSWLLILPFFKGGNKIVKRFLGVLSIAIIPYLYILSLLLKYPLVIQIGVCVSLIAIIGIWCIYGVFVKMKHRKLLAAGIALLICIPVTLGTNYVVPCFTGDAFPAYSDSLIGIISCLVSAVVCFGADFFVVHREG